MQKETVHLAFASDAEGVVGLAVAAFSALERCSRPVHVWVIEDGIPRAAREALEATWRRCPAFSGATFIAMASLPLAMPSWWARKGWPLTAAARFQLADVLPADVERCLYLDIDVLVGVDVSELHDLDLRGNPIGMAHNRHMPADVEAYLRTIGLDPAVYCNSGVALIDLAAWRRESAGRELIAVGRGMPPNIWFFDQDMLNTYFKGRCLLLEDRWNHVDSGVSPEGRIQHFAGGIKPWKLTAEAAVKPGHVAWHACLQRSGFVAPAVPRLVQWRKNLVVVAAKVQRRFVRP